MQKNANKVALNTSAIKKFFSIFASLKIAIACLMLAIILIFFGTLYQVDSGVFAAQDKIFRTFFIYWQPNGSNLKIPFFPGGYTIGGIFLSNLTAYIILFFKYSLRNLGINLIHLGIFLLVFGELMNGLFHSESLLQIKINEKKNYSLKIRTSELVIRNVSDNTRPLEIIFPESKITVGKQISHKELPFSLHVRKVFSNASVILDDKKNGQGVSQIATTGLGTTASVEVKPQSTKDTDINYLTAWVEIIGNNKSIGVWLLSSGIEQEQIFYYKGHQYNLLIRPERNYFPFSIELTKFERENHPRTNIPKHFSSVLNLYSNEGIFDRTAHITMNQPLRYQGRTFYQSGFGGDATLSVLQVVENQAWAMPYISSTLVIVGLIYQFICSCFFYRSKTS